MPCSLTVKKKPVNKSSGISRKGPHTKSDAAETNSIKDDDT
jgi:hypothetical protein